MNTRVMLDLNLTINYAKMYIKFQMRRTQRGHPTFSHLPFFGLSVAKRRDGGKQNDTDKNG
jgi:hypothetical protein